MTILKTVFTPSLFNVSAQKIEIIPRPNDLKIQQGVFNLSGKSIIYHDKNSKKEAAFLQQAIAKEHQLQLQVKEKDRDWTEKDIRKKLAPGSIYLTTSVIDADSMIHEEYRIES